MRATEIRRDISSEELRQAARGEKDGGMCRRLLGIACFLDGKSRSESQKVSCLTVSNFRIWLQRFNKSGIEGLRARKSPGRPCKLSSEIQKKLKEKVIQGPLIEEGLSRYRLRDLQSFLKENYGISVTLSGVWRQLQALGLTWRTGRQRHPKSDEIVQEDFKKTFLIT